MLAINQVLNGRYRIEASLGEGGMGAVYRAFDMLFDRYVALKEFRLGDLPSETEQFEETDHTIVRDSRPVQLTREKAMEQFFAEAKLLAKLEHSNLPKVYDFFNRGFEGYLVMTLIEGSSLEKILGENGGPLAEETVQGWLLQVMDALNYCHLMDVIHRDLKPANLLLTPDGLVYLVDFGIAKLLVAGQKETSTGARAYSPGFAPPEQYSGRGGTNPSSDIYSLGATAYALLTNITPTEPNDQISGESPLPPPRQMNPEISEKMERFILACLHLKKQERPQSILEARDLLLGTPPQLVEPVIPSKSLDAASQPKSQPIKPAKEDSNSKPASKQESPVVSQPVVPTPQIVQPVPPSIKEKPALPPSLQKKSAVKRKFPIWLVILLLLVGVFLLLKNFIPGFPSSLLESFGNLTSTQEVNKPATEAPARQVDDEDAIPGNTQSPTAQPVATTSGAFTCSDPNPTVSLNSHSFAKIDSLSFAYKVYFTSSSGWENGTYTFTMQPRKNSSFFCGQGEEVIRCSVNKINPDLLFCQYPITFSPESRRSSGTVYCDYDITLTEEACGDIHKYRYGYDFPVQ